MSPSKGHGVSGCNQATNTNMKTITIEGSKFTLVYETKNCHASVAFPPAESGTVDLRSKRNKRCETIAEAIDLAKALTDGANISHLDIH